jgi:hypothetical protein
MLHAVMRSFQLKEINTILHITFIKLCDVQRCARATCRNGVTPQLLSFFLYSVLLMSCCISGGWCCWSTAPPPSSPRGVLAQLLALLTTTTTTFHLCKKGLRHDEKLYYEV